MEFSDISEYYDVHARSWATQYDVKAQTMHSPVRDRTKTVSGLRTLRASEEMVLEIAAALDAHRIFDLGCGFASSLLYMANIKPEIIYSGICASDTEMELARERIRDAGRVQTVSVFRGDFEDGRNYRVFPAQDIVFALDSWHHARQPQKTLNLLASLVRPGGRLVVVDWFRVSDGDDLRPGELACLDQWQDAAGLPAIQDLSAFHAASDEAGFARVSDRPLGEDVALSGIAAMAMKLASPLVGGLDKATRQVWQARLAAEQARRKGLLDYRAIELIRP